MTGILRRLIGVIFMIFGVFLVFNSNFFVQMIGIVVIALGILMSLGR